VLSLVSAVIFVVVLVEAPDTFWSDTSFVFSTGVTIPYVSVVTIKNIAILNSCNDCFCLILIPPLTIFKILH
jgi:hypothetical protein